MCMGKCMFEIIKCTLHEIIPNKKCILFNVWVHRVLRKDRTPRATTSHKQIKDQYTDVCHMVKTLERETVHGPNKIATWSNLLWKRKKVT